MLQLQHHKHTAKLLPHQHTSYRALALLLMFVGVVLCQTAWSLRVAAAQTSFYLDATVKYRVPTVPATITSPRANFSQDKPTLQVEGTCPTMTPAIGIALYRNNAFVGSTTCDDNGSFATTVDLVAGANSLLARTVTVAGDHGPDGTAVQGTLRGAVTPATSPIINSEPTQLAFAPEQPVSWYGEISGGTAPYNVIVDWGDGVSEYSTVKAAGQLAFSHTYKLAVSRAVRIEVVDAQGTYRNLSVVAITPYLSTGSSLVTNNPAASGIQTSTLWALYTTYLTALAAFTLLWVIRHHQNRVLPLPVRSR